MTSDWMIPQTSDYAELGEYGVLLVVADGMGGANAGEVASAIAVETIQKLFVPEQLEAAVATDKSIQEFMKAVVKTADLNILHRSQEDSSTRGMGTTAVLAWILNDKAYVCWCGDSRCYVLNKQKGLIQLSKDHSYVQELVDKGELNPELMHDHPLSNVITRCLGDIEKRAEPETRIYQLHNGDIIMLCSDGLCGICHDDVILDTMIKYHQDPMDCKNELISSALSAGGYDNVTIALCNIEMEGDEDASMAEKGQNSSEDSQEDSDGKTHDQESEELSSTVRSEKIRPRRKFKWLICLFILLIAAGVYVYFSKDCEPIRNTIVGSFSDLISNIKQFKS